MEAQPSINEVVALERRLLDPAVRADRKEVDRLLHDEFIEVGASGGRWDRAAVLDLLAGDPGSAPELGDLLARVVTDDVVLVTYVARRLTGRAQASFRSSLWVKAVAGWRLRFHQGTPIPPAALSG
jgi:hypothetical protein